MVGDASTLSWVVGFRSDTTKTETPRTGSSKRAAQDSISSHAAILPEDDFLLIIFNAPLRVMDHARLAATALYEHLLPLVVDREVCDELLGAR